MTKKKFDITEDNEHYLRNCDEENNEDEHYLCNGDDEFVYFEDDDDNDGDSEFAALVDTEITRRAEFRKNIVQWAFQHNIPQVALKELFTIINKYADKPAMPKVPRTLLKTPQTVNISTIGVNQYYWHYGLQLCLENLLSNVSKPLTISLNINMDGLPVYKSARNELWPILFNVTEFPKVRPMVIGVYHGISKASNLEKYLTPMVTELKLIMENGLTINSHKVTVKLRCFVADSPARAFLKGRKYFSCYDFTYKMHVILYLQEPQISMPSKGAKSAH